MVMVGELTGRVAVVTGGGRGIGEACARLLSERGAKVAVADINLESAEAVARDIDGLAAEVDVIDAGGLAALADRVDEELGPTDIVVTSAGIIQRPQPPEELPEEVWDEVMEIDLKGTYLTCLAFGALMAGRGQGSIITIASGRRHAGHTVAFLRSGEGCGDQPDGWAAAEWGRSGVRVNSISPGYTLTPGLRGAIEDGRRDLAVLEEHSALGRLVEPEEVARAAAFLASDEAAAITGINLPVDAGWLTTGLWPTYGGMRPSRSTQGTSEP